MIPENTFEVIREGFGHIGTASNEKMPSHTDTLGAVINDKKDSITFFVRKSLSEKVLANLEENGKATVFIGVVSHEAYQFKGQFVEARTLSYQEQEVSEKNRNQFIEIMGGMGLPKPAVQRLFGVEPDIGITIKINDVFVQTPGPEAGKRLEI